MRTLGLQCLLLSFLYILMCRGNICCPKQLQSFIQASGYFGSSFYKVGVNITVDIPQQKLREDIDGAIYLFFFKEDLSYMIDNGTCYKGSSGPLPLIAFCIPDNATLSKHYRLGPSLLVSEYTFVDNASYLVSNFSRTVTKECMPIVDEQITNESDEEQASNNPWTVYTTILILNQVLFDTYVSF